MITVTSPVTLGTVGSSYTVAISIAGDFVNGGSLFINDGTNSLIATVTSGAGTTSLTVTSTAQSSESAVIALGAGITYTGFPISTLTGALSVKDFGAKGDGVTDDFGAINNALTAAALGAGVVYFPVGTYLLKSTLSLFSGCTLLGAGAPTTTLKAGVNAVPIIYDNTNTRSNILIDGLTFDGNSLSCTLLFIGGGKNNNIVITNCVFQNMGTGSPNIPAVLLGGYTDPTSYPPPISGDAGYLCRVSGCTFKNLVTGTREALVLVAWVDGIVDACFFDNCSTSGTGVLGLWAYHYKTIVRNCVFTSNVSSNAQTADAYIVESTGVSIEGCSFRSGHALQAAIIMYNTFGTQITNCDIEGYEGQSVGIFLYDHAVGHDPDRLLVVWPASGDIRIMGNYFYNCSTCMRLPSESGPYYNLDQGSFDIIGNHFSSITTAAMSIGGNGNVVQSIGPVLIEANTVDDGTWSVGFGCYSGVTGSLVGNIVGDSTASGSRGIVLDALDSPTSMLALGNVSSHHSSPWSVTNGATLSPAAGNVGYNPRGTSVPQPTVGTSPFIYTNTTGVDVTMYVSGGSVSNIEFGSVSTGLTSGSIRVPVTEQVKIVFTSAPTVKVVGD